MPKKQTTVNFTAKLPYRIEKKEKWVVSYCPLLDVYSQGNTEQEAIKNLIEALSLFFINCLEMGTLDRVLKDCGFTGGDLTKQSSKKLKNLVDVPIPLQYHKPKQMQCNA